MKAITIIYCFEFDLHFSYYWVLASVDIAVGIRFPTHAAHVVWLSIISHGYAHADLKLKIRVPRGYNVTE